MKPSSHPNTACCLPCLIVAVVCSVIPSTHAADIVKTADSNSAALNSGTHWPGGTAPTSGNNYSTGAYTLNWSGDTAVFAGNALTVANGGYLNLRSGSANSTSTATFNNGGLNLAGGTLYHWTSANNITFGLAGLMNVTSQSAIKFGTTNTSHFNIQSAITGSGLLGIQAWQAGAGSTVTVGGNNSNFSGGFNMGQWTDQATMSNVTLKVNHANALGTGILTMTYGTVDLNNFNPVVSALNGSNASGNFVQNNATGTSILTVGDSQNRNSSYAGVLKDGGTGKVLALTKAGSGTLTLSGTNTYSGATNINQGTLAVTGSGAINSTSSVTVAAGARLNYNSSVALSKGVTLNGSGADNRAVLGGSGPIGVAITLDNVGDVLSPGNSPGTQEYTVGQVWNSFSYDWEVNDFSDVTGLTAGSDFDQIAITGALSLTGGAGSYILNVLSLTSGNVSGEAPNFSEINRSWNIITATGGITGFNAANWTINTSGFANPEQGTWSLVQDGNNLQLVYVPEPSTFLLLGLAGLVPLLRRRRQG